jgi:RNA polymerase sigma-70 factor (ECF subfamily)
MVEDRNLVARALGGERGAFDEIVARYQDGLFRHLLRLTGSHDEAEDLCQEAFVGLYRALRRLDPERPLAPFLFTIAANAWRKRQRRAGWETEMPEESAQADGDSVSEQVLARLEHQQVLAAVARLQPEQREAVSLFYDQGLSYREIAGITGAPVGTVSTRLKRALETLRQALIPGGVGLVIPAGLGDLPQFLTSVLQGQATAPASIGPAVAHSISTLVPAGVGLSAIWKGALVMKKAIYVALGLVVVGGAVVGVPRLLNHSEATLPTTQVEVVKSAPNDPTAGDGMTADFVETSGGRETETFKLYSKGAKVRIEPAEESIIEILRQDMNVLWRLNPHNKIYYQIAMERPSEGAPGGFDVDAVAQILGRSKPFAKTLLGQETINGYLCDKYSLKLQDEHWPISSALIWYAKKPGLVVRINAIQDGRTIQFNLTNIRRVKLPDSLFEVPEGYTLQGGAQAGGEGTETANATKGEAPIEVFRAVTGGKFQFSNGGVEYDLSGQPKWRWHYFAFYKGIDFYGVGPGPVTISYLPDKNVFRLVGKAEVQYADGKTEVVTNRDINAPWQPGDSPVRRR